MIIYLQEKVECVLLQKMIVNYKKICVVILNLALGASFLVSASPSTNLDLNNDGVVDVLDVQYLVKVISHENNAEVLPDLNNDGITDIRDLQILLNNVGKKVFKGERSSDFIYNPTNLICLIKENTVSNKLVNQAEEFSDISLNKDYYSSQDSFLPKYFFSQRKIRGSLKLALHISSNSPPSI